MALCVNPTINSQGRVQGKTPENLYFIHMLNYLMKKTDRVIFILVDLYNLTIHLKYDYTNSAALSTKKNYN